MTDKPTRQAAEASGVQRDEVGVAVGFEGFLHLLSGTSGAFYNPRVKYFFNRVISES
jgi:hypothetical protein